jgi:hypothetical protein
MRWALAAAAVLCAACTVPVPGVGEGEREVRLARLASDHRALVDELENLQARLLVNRERVSFWTEMRGKHESVSAIACASQETHAVAIAEHLEQQQQQQQAAKRSGPQLRQARVAALRPSASAIPARTR